MSSNLMCHDDERKGGGVPRKPPHEAGLTADVAAIIDALPVADRAHSEDEYRTILKTTLDGFWVSDLQGRFLDVNEAYCQMIGYSRDELLTMAIPDIEALERPEETRARIDNIVANGFGRFESQHRRKDGQVVDVEVTTNYLPAGGRFIVFVRDITGQHRARLELVASEARFRGIFENATTGIAFADGTGTAISVNAAFQEILGYPAERLQGVNFARFTHPEDLPRELPLLEEAIQGRRDHYRLEKRLIRADGGIRWVDAFISAIRDDGGRVENFVGVVVDVTGRREAEAMRDLYAKVFHNSGEGIVITDVDNRIIAVNRAFTRLTGYQPEEVIGRNPRMLGSGKTPLDTYRSMWVSLYSHGYWQGEVWDRHKDGHVYPKWMSVTAVSDESGTVRHYIAGFTDVSERKAAEERISRLAHHDALTGLYNRLSLEDRLGQTLLTARREGQRVAVMFIDMDHFKTINDTLGHHIGDGLLVEVARRLQRIVRESDIVARLGGDEFVVVLAGIDADRAAVTVAEKIIGALGEAYEVDGHELHSSPTIGIGMFPGDGQDSRTLMKNADTAMYHAKAQGRNNFQFFTAEMNMAATRRMKMENDLRRAVAERQLLLFYQPKIEAASGRLCGVEALIRWQLPGEGLVPPGSFIPLAEECGLILSIGEWVIDEACRQLAEWKAAGAGRLHVAVNLSAAQLRSPQLVEQVRAALERHGLGSGELELEVTESTAMADPDQAIALLRALRDLGVTLAIDDFGTGYSSLAYLKRLPIQVLKLDRSFVSDIGSNEDGTAICAATIALAHTLGLRVVAEGVETEGQRAFLATEQGCDMLQGYLFGKPAPAAALLKDILGTSGP